MKKLIILAALTICAVVNLTAQPLYEFVPLLTVANRPVTLDPGWLVTATATSNYTALNKSANVQAANTVAVAVSAQLAGTGTDDTEVYFQKSIDGSVWETTPSLAVTNVNTGNTLKVYVHNLSVAGAHSIRLHSIKNNDAGDSLTNIVVSVGVKRKE